MTSRDLSDGLGDRSLLHQPRQHPDGGKRREAALTVSRRGRDPRRPSPEHGDRRRDGHPDRGADVDLWTASTSSSLAHVRGREQNSIPADDRVALRAHPIAAREISPFRARENQIWYAVSADSGLSIPNQTITTATLPRMKRRLFVLVATLGLVGGGVAVMSGAANAYPPGQAMTVSASPTFVSPEQLVTLVAHRVKPGCKVNFTLGDDSATTTANSGGVASTKLDAPDGTGWATVTATTVGCSFNETATTQIYVSKPAVSVSCTGEAGDPFTVTATGFPPNKAITLFISLHGKTVATDKTTTDSTGQASGVFSVSKQGSYLAVATSSGLAAAASFRIDS